MTQPLQARLTIRNVKTETIYILHEIKSLSINPHALSLWFSLEYLRSLVSPENSCWRHKAHYDISSAVKPSPISPVQTELSFCSVLVHVLETEKI